MVFFVRHKVIPNEFSKRISLCTY